MNLAVPGDPCQRCQRDGSEDRILTEAAVTQNGSLEAFEASDLGGGEIGELRVYEKDLAMVLCEQDVADLAETIEPGSSAAVLVWENLWARHSVPRCATPGASWPLGGRIPTQAVLAAMEADAGEGA